MLDETDEDVSPQETKAKTEAKAKTFNNLVFMIVIALP